MEYGFDIDDAVKYGLSEAVMIKNFRYWILKNKASSKHYYDGRTWTYNSAKSYTELFPFWTKKQIERILKSLITKNVLLVGNYNKLKYDQTRWFAFVDEKSNLEITKQKLPNYQMVTPIPNINTNINTDNNIAEEKIAFGEFENVFLSADDYDKLKLIYADKLDYAIDVLSAYIDRSDKQYKSHYSVMRRGNWVYERIMQENSKEEGWNYKDTGLF